MSNRVCVSTFVFFDNGVQQLSGLHHLDFSLCSQLETVSTAITLAKTSKTRKDGKDLSSFLLLSCTVPAPG